MLVRVYCQRLVIGERKTVRMSQLNQDIIWSIKNGDLDQVRDHVENKVSPCIVRVLYPSVFTLYAALCASPCFITSLCGGIIIFCLCSTWFFVCFYCDLCCFLSVNQSCWLLCDYSGEIGFAYIGNTYMMLMREISWIDFPWFLVMGFALFWSLLLWCTLVSAKLVIICFCTDFGGSLSVFFFRLPW